VRERDDSISNDEAEDNEGEATILDFEFGAEVILKARCIEIYEKLKLALKVSERRPGELKFVEKCYMLKSEKQANIAVVG